MRSAIVLSVLMGLLFYAAGLSVETFYASLIGLKG